MVNLLKVTSIFAVFRGQAHRQFTVLSPMAWKAGTLSQWSHCLPTFWSAHLASVASVAPPSSDFNPQSPKGSVAASGDEGRPPRCRVTLPSEQLCFHLGWCLGGPGSYNLRDLWFPTDYQYNFKLNTFLGSSPGRSSLPGMGEGAGLCIWKVTQLLGLLSLALASWNLSLPSSALCQQVYRIQKHFEFPLNNPLPPTLLLGDVDLTEDFVGEKE